MMHASALLPHGSRAIACGTHRRPCPRAHLAAAVRAGQPRRSLVVPCQSSLSSSDSEDISMPGSRAKALRAINEATKWVVSATVAVTVLLNPTVSVVWCLLGSLVNVVICKVLKRVIKEERPSAAAKDDHGMPSSHATSLAYLAVYTAVGLTTYNILGPWSNLVALGVLALGLFMAWLRVSCGYHTYPQVVVGFVLGSVVAVSWERIGVEYVVGKVHGAQLTAMYGVTAAACVLYIAKSLLAVKHDVARLQKVLE